MKAPVTFLATLLVTALAALTAAGAPKSNIVFILADDLGWSDTTLYGNTTYYKTPNLERLARRGTVFTQAYAASPLCSPTRSSIMTGLSPARTGITEPECHLPAVRMHASVEPGAPPYQKLLNCVSATRLDTKYFTLAEALKGAGYATGHFGKWHLGPEPFSPLQQGFDVDLPHWSGPGPAGSYVAPWKFPASLDFKPRVPNEHIEERMADEAVKWMEANKDHPFFLNYWQFSVHAPFNAKPDLIEKWRRTMDPSNPQHSPTYAAMVVAGEWKLIRIFYGGSQGAHAYRLYNLKEDIGERHDLAAAQPERVRQLDALIEKFLADTAAVTPRINPAFDPNAKVPPPAAKPAKKPGKKPVAPGNERLKREAEGDAGV